jgi:RNA polymerase sigma-70 factor (ECF subfamily)
VTTVNADELAEDQRWQSWIGRLSDGDELVIAEFWREYSGRLQGLAAQNLKAGLQRRVDPEDVVQSACRTFLRRLQAGDFELEGAENLWRLLCVITLAKVRAQARFHQRAKRSIENEQRLDAAPEESRAPGFQPAQRGPAPDEAAAFADQLDNLLARLDDEERQVVQLKLEDRTNDEIAHSMQCSERTVRRILNRVRSRLRTMLSEQDTP